MKPPGVGEPSDGQLAGFGLATLYLVLMQYTIYLNVPIQQDLAVNYM